jgi:hypothetical protein
MFGVDLSLFSWVAWGDMISLASGFSCVKIRALVMIKGNKVKSVRDVVPASLVSS